MAEDAILDSRVFFEIPGEDLDTGHYRYWLGLELLPKWLAGKEGNEEYACGPGKACMEPGKWNGEGGISGKIRGRYIVHCKFYKFDGEDQAIFDGRRGVFIRDHYSPGDVEKVMFISGSFEDFLKEEKVGYKRENFHRQS